MRGLICLLGGVLSLVTAAAPCKTTPELDVEGKIVADSGFRSNPNGFRFENWGGGSFPEGQLDAEDVRYIFGDRVCESIENDECTPTPATELWIEQMNQVMEGGHCEGMAALSAAFYSGYEEISDYGAKTTWALKPKADLLRTISAYFTTQMLEPVASESEASQALSMKEIIKTLRNALKPGSDDYFTLGIYGDEGGHAVTPYAVEELGKNRYRIHVYDNNYPGADKYIEVDTAKDHWRYAVAALNPAEDSAPWEGGSGSMDLTAMSTRFGDLECPFCGDDEQGYDTDEEESAADDEEAAAEDDEEVVAADDEEADSDQGLPSIFAGLDGLFGGRSAAPSRRSLRGMPAVPTAKEQRGPRSLFAFVDGACERVEAQEVKSGHRLMLKSGKVSSQIKGGQMRRIKGSRACLVALPASGDYQFSLRGAAKSDTTGVTFVAPGRVFRVSDLAQAPQQVDRFRVAADTFSFIAGSAKAPTLTLATDNPEGEDAVYTIRDAAATLGKNLSFRLDRKQTGLSFASEGDHAKTLDIRAVVSGLTGRKSYTFDQVKPEAKGWGLLKFDRQEGMKLQLEEDGKHPLSKLWGNALKE